MGYAVTLEFETEVDAPAVLKKLEADKRVRAATGPDRRTVAFDRFLEELRAKLKAIE